MENKAYRLLLYNHLYVLSVVAMPGMVLPMITHTQKGLEFHELIKLWCTMCASSRETCHKSLRFSPSGCFQGFRKRCNLLKY